MDAEPSLFHLHIDPPLDLSLEDQLLELHFGSLEGADIVVPLTVSTVNASINKWKLQARMTSKKTILGFSYSRFHATDSEIKEVFCFSYRKSCLMCIVEDGTELPTGLLGLFAKVAGKKTLSLFSSFDTGKEAKQQLMQRGLLVVYSSDRLKELSECGLLDFSTWMKEIDGCCMGAEVLANVAVEAYISWVASNKVGKQAKSGIHNKLKKMHKKK